MSDSFHHITESSELDLKKKGPKHTHLAMFLDFFRIGCRYDVNIRTVHLYNVTS